MSLKICLPKYDSQNMFSKYVQYVSQNMCVSQNMSLKLCSVCLRCTGKN